MPGVRLRGDAARILSGGRQVGNLYRWKIEGQDGEWRAEAQKYRLNEEADEWEFCFFIGELAIGAIGRFVTVPTIDGAVHRDSVHLEGARIWLQNGST